MSGLEKISQNFIKIKKQISNLNYSYEIIDLWNEIVGQQFSKNTLPIKFNKGIIYVSVFSSAWLNQINFFKLEIINKYNNHYKSDIVKDIKFFLKKNDIEQNNKIKTYYNKTNIEKTKLEELKEEDKKYINKCISSIEDENLKDKLENFFSIIRRKEITLIKKGWNRCKKCNILFNHNSEFCKSCR